MKSWVKKQIAVLLTLILAFSVTVPVSAEGTDESVQKVTVTLSGQYNNEFLFAPGEYTIPSDEAEKYGYTDEQGGVTTLDALVYAHEKAYGDKFTKEAKDDYLTVTDGSVKKAFEVESDPFSHNFDFLVNERYPNDGASNRYNIDQAKLSAGDKIDFYFDVDPGFQDRSTWFEKDGKKITDLVLEENSTANLVLKGYTHIWYGMSTEEEIQNDGVGYIENAQLTLIKIGEKKGKIIENATTDGLGNVILSGLTAGDYYLSAYVPVKEDDFNPTYIIMPLCKLRVVKYQDVLTNALANRKASIDNVSYGDEWAVLAQARNGNTDDAWYHSYYRSVEQTLAARKDNMIGEGTANARTAIAVTAMGLDATNVGGKNLLEPLADFSVAKGSYVTSAIYSLIALDCGNYEIPETSAEDKTTREKLIDTIISAFLDNGVIGGDGYVDIDSTAMAIQALAPYYESNDKAKETVDKALNYLSENQKADGTFESYDAVCTSAQVICALSALGIDAQTDKRFIKNNMSALDVILSYVKDDGSIAVENSYNPKESTAQAGYALVAYDRLKNGKNGLYEIAKDEVAADAFYKCAEADQTTANKKSATCTEDGYTGDVVCDTCGLVYEEGNAIPKKGHTVVIDPAVEPTEDKEGKTEGSHCSVCKKILKAQTVIPKKEKKPEQTASTEQATTAQATTQQATTQATTEAAKVVLKKPVIAKAKSSKKGQLKLTWKAAQNISGYQIQVSTSSKFKKAKTYNVKKSMLNKTLKGLVSGKKYYVRTRTYTKVTVDGKQQTIYSKWSKVKKITVK